MKRDREPIARSCRALSTTTSLAERSHHPVTGASDGIGREAALTYARYSASVILLGRNDDKLRTVARRLSVRVVFPSLVYPRPAHLYARACQQLAQQISMHYPRLDGVLHNAGLLGDICPMEEQKPEVWQQVMQVNVNGTFMLTGRFFLYYSVRNRARWSSPHPASVVRAAPTGAPMPFPNSLPKG